MNKYILCFLLFAGWIHAGSIDINYSNSDNKDSACVKLEDLYILNLITKRTYEVSLSGKIIIDSDTMGKISQISCFPTLKVKF